MDNGTDPTRLSRSAEVKYEHLDLRGDARLGTWRLSLTVPFGEKSDYSLRLRVPWARTDVVSGESRSGLGDSSLQATHVFGLTRARGLVIQGELIFDSASRPELGTGKDVFKGTFIYAKFLAGGHIFAPAIVHSASLGGDDSRARVNSTVFDFYYVPRFADPRTFVTIDPALNFDWETGSVFPSLAVTMGRSIGRMFGGNGQIFVKPSVFAGGERSANWGFEIGYKVIGF